MKEYREVLEKVKKLIEFHNEGILGGEVMPEDSNPKLARESEENYTYFTLPMSLNYQRNSYTLWKAALQTFNDSNTKDVFCPQKVIDMNFTELQDKLTKYKVALQKNKQTDIWLTISDTIVNKLQGDIRNLFLWNEYDVSKIKEYIKQNKKRFPYLSGPKISNYWLYVVSNYTDAGLKNVQKITIAPDTHIIQSSIRLGVITEDEIKRGNFREKISEKWNTILEGSGINPIDVHTPLWLWSRNGFQQDV